MEKKNGLAIAALVLAIISAVTFWAPIVNFVAIFVAIVGLILGLCALGHPKKAMAIVAVALCFVAIVGAVVINNITTKAVNETIDEVNEAFDEMDEAFDTSVEELTSMTTGQKNALEAAKLYLDVYPYSKDGLIKVLEFEDYSTEDAVYAADNCGTDWNEQAVKAAKFCLDVYPYSKDALIEALEFAEFTHEQAVYGAEQNGY